jgi:hypothetical protein
MPIPVPKLDDLTWDDLVAEGRSLIPSHAPEWTNFNTSDPGITLMETFAYLSEMLLYRLDQITDKTTLNMLRLIYGPDWTPSADLSNDKVRTIRHLHQCVRAVTAADYERLTLALNDTLGNSAPEHVGRVKCIPRRNLTNERPVALDEDSPGHFSVLVASGTRWPVSRELLRKVREHLEPARLLTARIHVVEARFVTVGVRFELVVDHSVNAAQVKARARLAVERFMDPLHGGHDHAGWPFGRAVHVSEIYDLLSKLPGVEYVTRARKHGEPQDELLVAPDEAARLTRNAAGELESVLLKADELVSAWIEEDDFDVASNGSRTRNR